MRQEITLVKPGLLGHVQFGQRWGKRLFNPGVESDHLQQDQLTCVSQQPVPRYHGQMSCGTESLRGPQLLQKHGMSARIRASDFFTVPTFLAQSPSLSSSDLVFGCLEVLWVHSRMPCHNGDIWLRVAFCSPLLWLDKSC